MKKALPFIIGISIGLVVIGVIIGVLFKTGIIKLPSKEQSTFVYATDSGAIYTEVKWNWKPVENKQVISYLEDIDTPVKKVTLHLDKDTYFDVTIPDTEYIYDYGKTIWAKDGTFLVRVVSDVTLDNLSSYAGIDNGIPLNQTTICSPDEKKGQKTIATLIDGCAIIVNVYSGDETYTIFRDTLARDNYSYELFDIPYADDYTELNKLRYNGKYVGQVVFQDISLEQKKYMFKDGTLWCSCAFDNLKNVKESYLVQLCVASGSSITEEYKKDNLFYAKSGNYYLGLIPYNTNTTIVLFGDGEETKCNIISIMNYLK